MKKVWKACRVLLLSIGSIALVFIILAFTTAPFWIRYGLGTKKAGVHRPPDYIVLLGGGGMPSESALMRCWYAAKAANWFTRSKIIIAQPGDVNDSLSTLQELKRELVLRGVAPQRILFEDSGTNTRAQAIFIQLRIRNEELGINKMYSSFPIPHSSLLIVTSPEHLYRSVLTFQKAGFRKVDGIPAFEKDVEGDLSFNARKLGGRKFIPDVGNNISLRYKFWTHLGYEIQITREYFALAYYKLMGWI